MNKCKFGTKIGHDFVLGIKGTSLLTVMLLALFQVGVANNFQSSEESYKSQLVANESSSDTQKKVTLKLHEVRLVSALDILAD
jgi:hypothetical protein